MPVETLGVLLIATAIAAVVARRLRVPSIGVLLLIGLGVGFLSIDIDPAMYQMIAYQVLLPPLIFQAALTIRWGDLRKDLLPLGTLVTLGLMLSMAVVVGGSSLLGWAVGPAITFGALISATDPVSVIAVLKENKITGRLALLLKGESLLNDATAAVAFAVAVPLFMSGMQTTLGPSDVLFVLGRLFGVLVPGLMAGAAVAGAGLLLAGATDDHLVELTITTVVAFGSFMLAHHLGGSGVLAALVAGLLLGNYGRLRVLTARGREAVDSFWEFAAFLSTSVIFLLLGVKMARMGGPTNWLIILAVAVLSILARAASVYGVSWLLHFTKRNLDAKEQHALVLGGMRGPLAIALALSLPSQFPMRVGILEATFACVAFSILVQMVSLPRLLPCGTKSPTANVESG